MAGAGRNIAVLRNVQNPESVRRERLHHVDAIDAQHFPKFIGELA